MKILKKKLSEVNNCSFIFIILPIVIYKQVLNCSQMICKKSEICLCTALSRIEEIVDT